MEDSERLFEKCLKLGLVPTKQTYTSMICGYCRDGKTNSALRVFEKVVGLECVADSATYGTLVSGLCKESSLDEARALYKAMLDKGLVPCEVSSITLAHEYCMKGKSEIDVSVLDCLEKMQWVRMTNILIRKLSSEGKMYASQVFLHKLLDEDHSVKHVGTKKVVDQIRLNPSGRARSTIPLIMGEICATFEGLLHYQYEIVRDLTFQILPTTFNQIGESSSYLMAGTIRSLADMQKLSDDDFPHRKQIWFKHMLAKKKMNLDNCSSPRFV